MCEQVAVAHEQQVAAVIGLVHDMAGDEQGRSAPGELVELFPQVDPQHGVKADGGFVEHQQIRVRHQRAGQRHSRALTAGKVAAQRSSVIVESDGGYGFVRGLRVGAVKRRRSSARCR